MRYVCNDNYKYPKSTFLLYLYYVHLPFHGKTVRLLNLENSARFDKYAE